MMHRLGEMRAAEHDGVQIVELPYEGGRYSLFLMRPEGSRPLAELGPISGDVWRAWRRALRSRIVNLTVPRVHLVRPAANIVPPLRACGVGLLFDEAAADLGRLGETSRRLFVRDVIQQTTLDLDEEGTRASATTTMLGEYERSASRHPDALVLVFDRPFVFMLRDAWTGAVLFVGRIETLGRH